MEAGRRATYCWRQRAGGGCRAPIYHSYFGKLKWGLRLLWFFCDFIMSKLMSLCSHDRGVLRNAPSDSHSAYRKTLWTGEIFESGKICRNFFLRLGEKKKSPLRGHKKNQVFISQQIRFYLSSRKGDYKQNTITRDPSGNETRKEEEKKCTAIGTQSTPSSLLFARSCSAKTAFPLMEKEAVVLIFIFRDWGR